jgi:hypothetical protein
MQLMHRICRMPLPRLFRESISSVEACGRECSSTEFSNPGGTNQGELRCRACGAMHFVGRRVWGGHHQVISFHKPLGWEWHCERAGVKRAIGPSTNS